jgi:hypothetical protein
MAAINVKGVVGRYSVGFDTGRKTIDTLLDALRKFFSVVGEQKKSKNGLSITHAQIVNFLPEASQELARLKRAHAELKEQCEHCMFDSAEDEQRESTRRSLSKKLNGVVKYVEHFQSLLQNRSVDDAAQSAIKHKKAVLGLIDEAKKHNKRFGAAIALFIRSEHFRELVVAPDSLVAINPRELTGSKAERRAFLGKIDGKLVAEMEAERRANQTFIERGNGAAHADNSDDDNAEEPVEIDEDVTVDSDDEESESNEYDENDGRGGETGDESGEMSHGAVLFESNLGKNNAALVREVEEKAVVRNGRALRKRAYRCIDLDAFGHLLPTVAVDDYRTASTSKRARTDDDEAAGSAMTDSDSSALDDDSLAAKQKALEAARAADAQAPFGE